MKKSSSELIQEIEVNDKQGDFLEAVYFELGAEGTKTAAMIGGIGSGKSFAMAMLMLMSKEELPKAKGQFACLTVTQFQRSIFPGVKSVWREYFELVEYNSKSQSGDYVVGKKPPEDWDRPWQEPDNWDNCIAFPNGWVMEICGYKMNADIHRGRNDDFAFMDEALLFKREWLKILEGRIRANKGKYDSNLHWLISVFSSPPYGSGGEWMFDMEDLMKEEPDRYFFTQITTKDNLVFLPGNYVDNLKKKLTRLEFDVEVQGKRLTKIPKGFYAALSDRHEDIDFETFYSTYQEVIAVVDFNAHFTSCTVWQDRGQPQHCVMNAFVKEPEPDMSMSQSLAIELLKRLEGHHRKTLHLTGDRNGLNASAASKKRLDGTWITLFDEFAEIFKKAGWDVVLCPLSYNPLKDEIHTLMHGILTETREDGLIMRFHPVYAKSTIVSMQQAPLLPDYKKDKRSESKDGDQERATHLSDTVDYYAAWRCLGGIGPIDGGFDMSFL